jgi:hypothetical protein
MASPKNSTEPTGLGTSFSYRQRELSLLTQAKNPRAQGEPARDALGDSVRRTAAAARESSLAGVHARARAAQAQAAGMASRAKAPSRRLLCRHAKPLLADGSALCNASVQRSALVFHRKSAENHASCLRRLIASPLFPDLRAMPSPRTLFLVSWMLVRP